MSLHAHTHTQPHSVVCSVLVHNIPCLASAKGIRQSHAIETTSLPPFICLLICCYNFVDLGNKLHMLKMPISECELLCFTPIFFAFTYISYALAYTTCTICSSDNNPN